MNNAPFQCHFDVIEDKRQAWKIRHNLHEVIFLVVSAVTAGAEGWEEIEDFGKCRIIWLRQYGAYENGIAHHDTISRLMRLIDPKKFQKCFINWVHARGKFVPGSTIAIDGKTLKGSRDGANSIDGIHMVNALCVENQEILGQVKTDEKSNEITAIPELLDMLQITGCLVTIDAMGCQVKIAQQITNSYADYLLSLKANHGKLYEKLAAFFTLEKIHELGTGNTYEAEKINADYCVVADNKEHDREDVRFYFTCDLFGEFEELAEKWPSIRKLCIVVSHRIVGGVIPKEPAIHFCISSRDLSAEEFGIAKRLHWGIENKVHWILDVAMNEDACRIRKGSSPAILATVRQMGINLIKQDTSRTGGVQRKQKMMAMDEEYLSQVIES